MKYLTKIIWFLAIIGISTAFSAFIVLNLPLSLFEGTQEPQFGSTITTILGTDTLTNSRTTINNNFSALNSSKAEISDVSATTTLSSLASVGTITTGTWNATKIGVPYGGTGWSNVASGTIMYGLGASSFGTTTAGSNGQVLALSGGTPTWTSVSVDQSLAYTWTGLHTFSVGFLATASSTFNATTSIAASSLTNKALILNGLPYVWPSSRGSNEAVLSENGSGTLSFSDVTTLGAGAFLLASTTDLSLNDSIVETTYATTTVPANLLGTLGALAVKVYATTYNDNGNNSRVTIRVKFGSTTVCSAGLASGASNYGVTQYEMILSASSSAALQQCQGWSSAPSAHGYTETSSSVDTTSAQTLTITAQWDVNDGGDSEAFTIGGANITFLGR